MIRCDTTGQSIVEKLYVHFDVENHYITSYEFIQTVKSIEITYNDLLNNLIHEKINIKSAYNCNLIVFPPKSGTFLIDLGLPTLTVVTIIKFVFDSLETDIGKKLVKGLTENEPSYYAEKLGKLIRDCIIGILTKSNEELRKLIDELEQISSDVINIDASLKAKSDFYKMCLSSESIKAVGFDNSEIFPIKRNEFIYHISDDIIRALPSEYMLQELIIVKPVTVTDSDAKWSLRDCYTKKNDNYSMKDTDFKTDFLSGHYPLKESQNPDKIIAKVEYEKELKNGEEKIKSINVIEVYGFNDKHFKTIPNDLVLNKPTFSSPDSSGQMNLFEELADEL